MIDVRNRAHSQRSLAKSVDWWLVASYILLVLIGWINIYASVHTGYNENVSIFDLNERSGMQMLWIGISSVFAVLILFVLPPRLYESVSVPLYCFVVALLVIVIFVSSDVKGSHSWFDFGPVKFQPAEISKITTSLLLATFMSRYSFKMSNMRDFILSAAIILVPMLIIVLEDETGSALVYIGFIFMMYREGLSGWVLIFFFAIIALFILTLVVSPYAAILTAMAAVVIGNCLNSGKIKTLLTTCLPVMILLILWPIVHDKVLETNPESFLVNIKKEYVLIPFIVFLIPYLAIKAIREKDNFKLLSVPALIVGIVLAVSVDFVFENVLKDYQRGRIEYLLGMSTDTAGVGYNVNQSMIAIGSGGFWGKGYLQGTQNTGGFVPEQSTDFIFCTIGEEWGFVGCFIVICLYVFLIWRIIASAEKSREAFTRIYGYCIAGIFFMHLFINVGMTIGLMPVIGIPLPMISYGGSSLLSFTIMLFIFIALDHNENKYF